MTRRLRRALVPVAGLLLGAAVLSAQTPTAPSYAGRPLMEALRDLQSRGLDIFFSSNLVRPEMEVAEDPAADDPREVLYRLLMPHGLTVVVGPGGRLVVVTAASIPSGIRGSVRERGTGRPLSGVRILVPGTTRQVESGADGAFLLSGVEAGTHPLEAHLPGYLVQRVDEFVVSPQRFAQVVIELEAMPVELDEIVVTPSRVSLLSQEPVTAVHLDRNDILALPHLGDDIFRAFTLLPGVSGEEVSARFHVRGGRHDEVLVLLDRVELFEPYHLKDFSSSLSIIAPRALGEVHLMTGGFPAQYGDRMSGVLDMTTTVPQRPKTQLGVGLLSAEFSSSGTFDDARGHWLGTVRRGSLDLALDVVGQPERPRYWDAFGKGEYQLRPGQRLGAHVLHSHDTLDSFKLEDEESEHYFTSYGNSYAWLTHQAILGPRLFADTTASLGRVGRDRGGIEDEDEDAGFTLRDQRHLDATGLKQDWNLQATTRHYARWGFDVRRLVTDYDYLNRRVLDDPLAAIRSQPRSGTTLFREDLHGEQLSAYVSDRLRVSRPLTLELGLRYDQHTLPDDSNLSPRLNLVYAPSRRSALRLAWGYFYQSQRPYELQVEDGETDLVTAERTEQRIVGFDHRFPGGAGKERSDLFLRVEAYQRKVKDPRVRYENLFEPVSIFPEIEPDRIRIAPQTSAAYGLEVFLRGNLSRRLGWWASYAYARVEDRIDGRRVPRRIDQPHTVNLDLNYHVGRHWDLNLAWRYHTGWPTTAVMGRLGVDDEGEVEVTPVFGPINAERLPVYHRLDLRASREWQMDRGVLGFFLEIQNVYDRGNVAGFDVDFGYTVRPGGEIDVMAIEEIWGHFLPSFGITWEF